MWGTLEWEVTPLQTFSGRAKQERHVLEGLKKILTCCPAWTETSIFSVFPREYFFNTLRTYSMGKFLVRLLINIFLYSFPLTCTLFFSCIVSYTLAVRTNWEQTFKKFNLPSAFHDCFQVINVNRPKRHAQKAEEKCHGDMLRMESMDKASYV